MKTPEDIKKGLAGCNARRCAKDCPYGDTIPCVMMMHKDACEYIQQLEAQVPKWISVEERLPDETGAYAVYGNRRIAFATFYPSIQMWVSNVDSAITHWMPLPEPPKENDENNDKL